MFFFLMVWMMIRVVWWRLTGGWCSCWSPGDDETRVADSENGGAVLIGKNSFPVKTMMGKSYWWTPGIFLLWCFGSCDCVLFVQQILAVSVIIFGNRTFVIMSHWSYHFAFCRCLLKRPNKRWGPHRRSSSGVVFFGFVWKYMFSKQILWFIMVILGIPHFQSHIATNSTWDLLFFEFSNGSIHRELKDFFCKSPAIFHAEKFPHVQKKKRWFSFTFGQII